MPWFKAVELDYFIVTVLYQRIKLTVKNTDNVSVNTQSVRMDFFIKFKAVSTWQKIHSRVITHIKIHTQGQNAGRERKKERKSHVQELLPITDIQWKNNTEHCLKVTFSMSISLVDCQHH